MTSATLETHQAPAHRNPLTDRIGECLRRMRVENELSLPAAAALCGNSFSARSLRRWERGVQDMSIDTLNTILDAYGVNTGWFMDEAVLFARRLQVAHPTLVSV